MSTTFSSSTLDAIAEFFITHLLINYKEAANDACSAYAISAFFTNYTLGGTFWDSSHQRIVALCQKNEDLRQFISFANNTLIFNIAGTEFRCYRVPPETGIPHGAIAFKKSLKRDQHLLTSDFEQYIPQGKLMVGFHVDSEEGLVKADLSEIYPRIDSKGFTRNPLLTLFNASSSMPLFPAETERPKPARPKVSFEGAMGLEAVKK
ncbi:hypothetical protein [Desulfovibrio psychrotolerans]|uniref:Uncharacterized protein n=1 Tax=Desulfovibrio psychrotolerans TaxID=415242 RepID=A0A7J0BQS9_9BACT|nr:hypothetical protein [Desulfovibrio psychrotolerans]GFM36073.1 hypothetical protein DSM19430T_07570 [Desulfovibrio psychrotolerans]